MTDWNFRHISPAPDFEAEMSGDPWYSIRKDDVFLEEFERFLLVSDTIRDAFMKYHADLLDESCRHETQEDIRYGVVKDFFPYPESLRFSVRFAHGLPVAAQ